MLSPEAYVGMGSGTQLAQAPFKCEEGVHQGAIESGWFFSLACNKAFQKLNTRLAAVGGGVMAIINDNYTMGLPEHIFPASRAFASDLAEVGLELQPAKSKCYIKEEFRNAAWDVARGDIPDGVLKDVNGDPLTVNNMPLHGITTCNVPIGSEDFVKGYLQQRLAMITDGFENISHLLDPGRWPHPEIPSRQMILILTVVCFQFMGDYWLRHVRPDFTEDSASEMNKGVMSLFETCIGSKTESWTAFARERMRLPIQNKGCGLREAVDRRHGQFLGAIL